MKLAPVITISLLLAALVRTPAQSQFVVVPPDSEHEHAAFLNSLFEGLASELNDDFRLPREVGMTSARCEQANAFYYAQGSTIVVCSELVDQIRENARRSTSEESLLALSIVSQMAFILIHEVGHALVHVLDLPVLGQEEDAADQLAALLMSDEPILAMWAAQFWRSPAGGAGRPLTGAAFADEHDLGEQRFFNLTCWSYGADPLVRGYVATAGGLPAERAQRCPAEFQRLRSSFERLLTPHLVNAQAFTELDPTRNASGYWRFMEAMQDEGGSTRCTASGTLALWETGGDLTGQMTQQGSCVWGGVPLDNTADSAIETGSAADGHITFTLSGCEYRGSLEDLTGTQVEGTVTCRSQTDRGVVELVGTWRAVR